MSVDKEEMLRKIKDALYVSENNPQIHHHWLRALLAENEQWADGCDELNKQIETLKKRMNRLAETSVDKSEHQETQHQLTEALKLWGECEEQNRQLREENERLKELVDVWETESFRVNGEIEQFRSELAAKDKVLVKAENFISRIMGFYGQGLQVANWHQNDDLEPWDNFFDENMDGDELEMIRTILSQYQKE